MLTEQQIFNFATGFRATHETAFCTGVQFGARWANDQNAAEIARLEAEKAELLDVLETAFERIALALQDIKTVGMSAIPRDIKAVTEISMLLEKHGRI